MKTAMQELIDEIKLIESYPMNPLVLRIATDLLEKEKEQIIEARIDGITCAAAFQEMPSKYTTGEQYYNQTYKQISDIVVDAIKSQVTTTDVWTPKTN
jgi:hypothetical protein